MSPKLITSIDCLEGGDDTLYGGNGDVDYIIGGAHNDTIQGNDGMDLVFGDHALIELYENESHKLRFAKTILEFCAGGDDHITLGPGDDMAFGGAYNDYIEGNDGQDVILGDFGLFNATNEFLPNQYYESIFNSSFAGSDHITGGPGDDVLMGQEVGSTHRWPEQKDTFSSLFLKRAIFLTFISLGR